MCVAWAFAIQKISWRVSYWGPHSSFLYKVHAWSILFLGPKAPKASTGPRLGPTVRVVPGTIVVSDLE